MALFMPDGAHPSSMLMFAMSVFNAAPALVDEYSEIFVFAICFP
jgi:hypothetical protein